MIPQGMRRWRFAARCLGVLAMTLLLALIAGIVVPRPLFTPQGEHDAAARKILLLSNPIHTDLALPLDADLAERFGFLADAGLPMQNTGARFLVFGWGGREFYLRTPTWSDLEVSTVARAFTLDASVMHVAVAGEINAQDPAVTALTITPHGYASMLDAITATFDTATPSGVLTPVGQGYSWNDAFFAANGRFNAFLGCNTWTASMLRSAGLQTGYWTPLPPLLRWSLQLHNDDALTDAVTPGPGA